MKINPPRNDHSLQTKWAQKRVVYTEDNPPPKVGLDFSDDIDIVDQSGADEADINNIVSRYHKTGVLPGIDAPQVFADVSDSLSYQEALQTVITAEAQFMALDATTRKKFDNNPAEFLAFVDDPRNAQELVQMGLATLAPSTPSPAAPEAPEAPSRSSKAKAKSPPAETEE